MAEAGRNLAGLTTREQAHATALTHWLDGRIECALATWEEILSSHPRDVLAFRLHHFSAFWRGRPELMLSVVERVLPHWSSTTPGYGAVLACRAFAHEECGDYGLAEASGRQAVDLKPENIRAAHAVAHVLEMLGRPADGMLFLGGLEPHWEHNNNLKYHLGGIAPCFTSSAASLRRCSTCTITGSAIWHHLSCKLSRTSTSTCRTRRRCCSASSCAASTSTAVRSSWPTRPRPGLATACRRSPCRIG